MRWSSGFVAFCCVVFILACRRQERRRRLCRRGTITFIILPFGIVIFTSLYLFIDTLFSMPASQEEGGGPRWRDACNTILVARRLLGLAEKGNTQKKGFCSMFILEFLEVGVGYFVLAWDTDTDIDL